MRKLSRRHQKINAKRGAVSLYVVIFTTLLFGIITLSFVRLILSESIQTSNSDLSQSAYDSALAGVEDAKIALLQYHECLSQGYTPKETGNKCEKIIFNMQKGIREDSCDTVSKTLSRSQESDGSIIIQETKNTKQAGTAEEMLQAYTCVKVAEELPDYRATLNNDTRLRIIPIRSADINRLGGIGIKWYSDQNRAGSFNWSGVRGKNASTPPVISVQLLQADATFRLSELSASSSVGTDHGTVYLVPSKTKGRSVTEIANNDPLKTSFGFRNLIEANTLRSTSNKDPNEPYNVLCSDVSDLTAEWYCSTFIKIPAPYRNTNRNDGATFVIVTLPYGYPTTDISLQIFDTSNNVIAFDGVQARVDSTGRANDLYRRVETRVELVDLNYPYPEFAIEMHDDAGNVIKKNFAVTRNCWTANNGSYNRCPDNQELN